MGAGGAPALEALLRRERLIIAAGLGGLCALAWAYLASGAGLGMSPAAMAGLSLFPHRVVEAAAGMGMPDMPGMASPGLRPAAWSPDTWVLTTAMWWTMMVAMMTPTAAPTILLYGRVQRHAAARAEAGGVAPSSVFTAGYLAIWLAFSLAAAVVQWGLQDAGLVSTGTLASHSRWLSAAVLIAAGLYQLSPLQAVCLGHCRSPAGFLSRHWRPGLLGALRLGAWHGAYCLGCCWLLMALLFVGGVMNLVWVAALSLLILAEKLVPGGRRIASASGLVLLAWGAATLLV